MMLRLFALAILAISLPAHADIYKCKDARGQVTFSQMPCGHDAQKIKVETVEPTDEQRAQSAAAMNQQKAIASAADHDRAVANAQARIDQLVSERDAKLAALRNKKRYANNNLAGATWEKSISDEMQAVAQRYNADIANARADLQAIESAKSGKHTESGDQ